ncbi:MAG: hypothetical protein AAF388_09185 [Bacteroidota bacterium]
MRKSILLLLTVFILSLIDACICRDSKYLDFDEITIIVDEPAISQGDSLVLFLEPLDVRYVGQASPAFSLFSSTYAAIDCDYGWGGLKFPLSSVSIRSNQDFNANFPAGTELNELFFLDTYIYEAPGDERIKPLAEVDLDNLISSELILREFPTAAKEHIFRIELIREKGDTLTAFSPKVTWE